MHAKVFSSRRWLTKGQSLEVWDNAMDIYHKMMAAGHKALEAEDLATKAAIDLGPKRTKINPSEEDPDWSPASAESLMTEDSGKGKRKGVGKRGGRGGRGGGRGVARGGRARGRKAMRTDQPNAGAEHESTPPRAAPHPYGFEGGSCLHCGDKTGVCADGVCKHKEDDDTAKVAGDTSAPVRTDECEE